MVPPIIPAILYLITLELFPVPVKTFFLIPQGRRGEFSKKPRCTFMLLGFTLLIACFLGIDGRRFRQNQIEI